MQRITISIDDDLLKTIDDLSERRGYTSRSEALRDIVRDTVAQEQISGAGDAPCYAALLRLRARDARSGAPTDQRTASSSLSVSTLHVHVGSRNCLEVAVLKGTVQAVKALPMEFISPEGVRHGNLRDGRPP